MLRVYQVKVLYGGIPALHEVSFEIKERELVTLVGANGSGKSTILKAIVGGSQSFFGED